MNDFNPAFEEQSFPFADNTTGILTLPRTGGHYPVVILLHGFASYHDEVGGLFSMLSENLAKENIASLRFTFNNFQLPEHELVNSSFDAMLAEVQLAYNTLLEHPRINASAIGVLGFSLGGAVAVVSAAAHPEQYKALVTWSCAANLEQSFRQITGNTLFDKALAGEDLALDLGWRKIRLSAAFFQSLTRHKPIQEINSYSRPFLAIAGTADPLSTYTADFLDKSSSEIKEKLLFNNADHIFNVLEEPAKHVKPLLTKTEEWFKGPSLISGEQFLRQFITNRVAGLST